jgi:hypothetical protein
LRRYTEASTVRCVVDRHRVGTDLGLFSSSASKDLLLEGDCDDVFLRLAAECGWVDDLLSYVDAMAEASRAKVRRWLSRRESVNTLKVDGTSVATSGE